MNLIYFKEAEELLDKQLLETSGDDSLKTPYAKLGSDLDTGDVKKIWIFPDIARSFKDIQLNETKIIKPFKYYVTSGEAVRKTEVLINDIKELVSYNVKSCVIEQVTSLLIDLDEFLTLLINTKGPAKYLELTKCEDGIYNGNICARKNPKKKKDEEPLDD